MLPLRVACGGFLIAVLVCDLTFDLPVFRAPPSDPVALERALQDATAYYARITGKGSLLATCVALVMLTLLGSLGYEWSLGPPVYGVARFVLESSLAVGPIAVAGIWTLPRARRLGASDVTLRAQLARAIARDHMLLLPSMLSYVSLQLWRA